MKLNLKNLCFIEACAVNVVSRLVQILPIFAWPVYEVKLTSAKAFRNRSLYLSASNVKGTVQHYFILLKVEIYMWESHWDMLR